MAKVVSGLATTIKTSRYDWDSWFNGDVWELKRGEDFNQTALSFRGVASTRAKRQGLKIRTRIPEEKTIQIQAYKP